MTEVRKHKRQTASGKTTTVRHHTRKGGDGRDDGPQEKFLLTVRRRSGKPVNAITGAPEDTIMVHGRADLERRLAAAAADPDYEVTYRENRASPPVVGSPELAAASQPAQDESWWDEDEAPAGEFWAEDEEPEPEPSPPPQTRAEKKAAMQRYKAAREALWENSDREYAAGIRYETEEYHRLNDARIEAEKHIPWWRHT